MEVIKSGKKPEDKQHEWTCRNCKAVIRAKQGEGRYQSGTEVGGRVDPLVSEPSRESVIAMLIAISRAAHALADGTCDDGERLTVDEDDFNDLSHVLDALDQLPEPGPNLWGTGPAKAEAFLAR